MADNYKFTITGSDKTRAMFKSLRGNLGNLRGAVNSTATKLVGLAGAAGLGAMVKSSLATNDALAKTADRLGLTTQALSGLQRAAELSGAGTRTLDMGLQRMTRRVAEAARGTGEAKDAIAELGLSAQELAQLSPDQQFRRIAGAMQGVSNQGDRVRLAMKLFDSEGVKLVNTLAMGEEGLDEAQRKVEQYGVALSRVDAAQMEAANDAMFNARQVSQGLANQLTIKLAPIIEQVAVSFAEAATAGGGMGAMVEKAFQKGVRVAGVFADGVHGLKVIFQGLQTLAQGLFAALSTGFAVMVESVMALSNSIVDGLFWPIRKVMELLAPFSATAAQALADVDTLVDGLKFKAPQGLRDFAAAQREAFSESKQQLHELLMTELPSEVLKGKVDEILAAAEVRAQDIAAKAGASAGLTGSAANDGDGNQKGADGLSDREREQLAAKLETLKLSWLSELEQLQVKQDSEMALLDQAFAEKLIKHDEYERNLAALEGKHAKEREKLEQASGKNRLASVTGAFQQMLGVAGSGNKKLFKLQKALSLAQAAASIPSAVIESYKNAGGYPWGIPAAAAMAAAGAAQLAQIKSASFNGGSGGAGSVGGGIGGSAVASAPPSQGASLAGVSQFAGNDSRQGPATLVQLTVNGDVVGGGVEAIAGRLGQLMNEQDLVIIDPNSRQAQELRG